MFYGFPSLVPVAFFSASAAFVRSETQHSLLEKCGSAETGGPATRLHPRPDLIEFAFNQPTPSPQ
jgi:hypothetical protein